MSRRNFSCFIFLFFVAFLALPNANALTLDWSGYFRASHDAIYNYQMDRASPGYSDSGDTGEYIKGQGDKNATFSTFFMKLKP